MRNKLRASLVVALLSVGAAASVWPAGVPQAIAESLSADLILLNGKVVTMDDSDQVAEAVAIKGGRIAAVGSDATVQSLAGRSTKVIDLAGRLALPGLVDAHSHTGGVPPDYLDLFEVRSIAEIQEAVAKKVATTPPGKWIVGSGRFMIYSGWDEHRLLEKRWLTRRDIDPGGTCGGSE
jgi:predicted amidohydrolase YtcJ